MYNLADVKLFIEAVDQARRQYCEDVIDILRDAMSIPGVSIRHVLNKALRLNLKIGASAAVFCFTKTNNGCEVVQKACIECTKKKLIRFYKRVWLVAPQSCSVGITSRMLLE